MSTNQETNEFLTQMGIDVKNRFDELDELIKHVTEVCEKTYRDGYLQGREDLRRELHAEIEGNMRQKEFDEFERAGFSPEECEGLREIRDKCGFPSDSLINMAKLITKGN